MNNIGEKTFDINKELIAGEIYTGKSRIVDEKGLEIDSETCLEFSRFLEEFNDFAGVEKNSFYRIDCYMNDGILYVLDINASFVDGWGNAMNISRSASLQIDEILLLAFPERFYLGEEVYRPEFELFLSEMNDRGFEACEIGDTNDSRIETYGYGNLNKRDNLYPYDGTRLDNKMLLALFSKQWDGNKVNIPTIQTPFDSSWNSLDENGVFKVNSKADIAKLKRRTDKVRIGGYKSKLYAEKLWSEGKAIVQKRVPTIKIGGLNTQAIILTINSSALVGYIQKSADKIINDSSIQAPLKLGS